MEENNKFLSRKLIITVWCCILITLIVILDKGEFVGLATALAVVPTSYTVANVAQKRFMQEKEKRDKDEQ